MHVNGLIVEDLNEKGELKSFVLNNDNYIGDMWVAFPDKYDSPRSGPYHFLDDSHEKLFATFYKDQKMRKVGFKNFKQISENQYEFHSHWSNIPVRKSYELYYYSLYLPKYAFPIFINYDLANRSLGDTDLLKVLKDKDRYVIYIKCVGSKDERISFSQSLDLKVIFEINQELFNSREYQNIESHAEYKHTKSHEDKVKDFYIFYGEQFENLKKLLEYLRTGSIIPEGILHLGQLQTGIKKILLVASNPLNTTRLRLDRECREIEEGLRRANRRGNFILVKKFAVRPIDLSRALLDEKPYILHFSGHGSEEGIALENDTGNSYIVTPDGISELFGLFKDSLHCVILNSCYSEIQARSIARHIPYVIGMKKEISDQTAINFAISFYDAIGDGNDINFAFDFAKKNLSLKNLQGKENLILLQKIT